MKNRYLRVILMSIKYSFYVFFLQCLFLTSLSASDAKAQLKSVKEVYVAAEFKDAGIVDIFEDIESKTDFRFHFFKKDIKKGLKLSLNFNKVTVADVLLSVSEKADLHFRQLNANISVSKITNVADHEELKRLEVIDFDPIKGVVTDELGEPLAGVNVVIKGTTQGTIANVDGEFQLDVPKGATLVFSFIGYSAKEVKVSSFDTMLAVQLDHDIQQLSEVVVVGYGEKQKRDISGAVASVKSEEIENMPIQSFDKALQGRAAGVLVSSSGIPGGATEIRIRGRGSITAGNEPLYIIDGVQVTSTDQSRLISSANPLNSINPNDIESIDVLKDAAAASIYGAQGANGVVIITTKRGKAGVTKFNFNASFGKMDLLEKREVLTGSEFVELTLEAYENRFGTDNVNYQGILGILGLPENASNFDWQDAVFGSGSMRTYELSASGGSEKTNFYISGNYNDINTHVVGTEYERGGLRLNFDHKANDKLKISPTINVSRVRQRVPLQGGFFSNPNRSAHLIAPINAIYLEDGSFNPSEYGGGNSFFGSYDVNVVRDAGLNETSATTTSTNGNLVFEYKILDGLKFKSIYGVDYLEIEETQWLDPRTRDGGVPNGQASALSTRVMNWQTDQVLSYERTLLDKHSFTGILGVFHRQSVTEGITAEGQGFPTYKLQSIQNAAIASGVTSFYTTFKTNGVFGRLDYIYDDKYIFAFTVRRDGNSRFGRNTRFGTFPAASLGWRLSSEEFMPKFGWLNDLKLRASYGITGNSSIDNFASRGLYGTGGEYDGSAGLQPSKVENPILTWEENKTINVGLDLTVFEGRITFGLDRYVRTNSKLLLDRPLPNTTGFDEITENAGSIRNMGWEFELNTTNLVIGDFNWTTNANLALQKSEVIDLPDVIGDTLVISNFGGWYVVGQPAFAVYQQTYAGVNAADGRPFWLDQDGNPTYQHTSGNARVFQGVSIPKWLGGVTNTFSYKGVQLSAFFQFQGGHLLNNIERSFTDRAGSTADRNQRSNQLDRWQEPGDITDVPIAVLGFAYPNDGASPWNTGNDSRNTERGDYLRLKQIQISYNLPSKWLDRVKLQSAQIYGQAINYWTLTDYTGYDPEFLGSDFGDLPQPKTLILGLQVGF